MTSALKKSQSQTPQDLSVAILPMRARDPIHGANLARLLELLAASHGEKCDPNSFNTVVQSIETNNIQCSFALFNSPTSILQTAGTIVKYPTVLTRWDGNAFQYTPATCIEDLIVRQEDSENFRRASNGKGLGYYVVTEEIKKLAVGTEKSIPSGSIVFEHAANNGKIESIFKKLGGNVDSSNKNIVLKIPSKFCRLTQKEYIDVEVIESLGSMQSNGDVIAIPYVYATAAHDRKNNQHLSISYTKGLSTFTGLPSIMAQITSSGNLTDPVWTKDALLTMFSMAQQEISKENWFPWWGNFKKCSDFLGSLKIHTAEEPFANEVIKKMGAQERTLGGIPMKSVILDFQKIPSEILITPPIRPLTVVRGGSAQRINKSNHTLYSQDFIPING